MPNNIGPYSYNHPNDIYGASRCVYGIEIRGGRVNSKTAVIFSTTPVVEYQVRIYTKFNLLKGYLYRVGNKLSDTLNVPFVSNWFMSVKIAVNCKF